MNKKTFQFCYFVISTCFLLSSTSSHAQSKTYELSWGTDGVLLGASIGLTTVALTNNQKILTLQEIETLDRLNINSFDRGATNNYSPSAISLSDVFRDAVVVLPLSLLAFKKSRNEAGVIGLMLLETFTITTGVTFATKTITRRVRPLVYNENFPIEEKLKATATRSFFSGHASHVSALSFFSAKVFNDLYPDSKFGNVAWAAAITIPAFTGYLRYRGGKHFPSDVIVGYGVGAAMGILIPQFHKMKNENLSINAVPLSDGGLVNLSLRF